MEKQIPTTMRFNILMFPWLAHGHIFPYLELAKNLLQTNKNKNKNLHIYVCSTPINFTSIQDFITEKSLQNSVTLVQLHIQPTPQLPPHYHTTKNLPSSLNFALLKALQTSHASFSEIVSALRPHLVIHDVFQPWAAKIAASQSIPAVYFSIFGSATLSYVHHQYTFGKEADFPYPEIRFQDHELRSLEFLFDYLYANIYDVDPAFLFGCFKQSTDIVLIKTSSGIEQKYLNYLTSLSGKKVLPVGSLLPDRDKKNDVEGSEIIRWLDSKSRHSTVYVSFGSEYFLSEAEIAEIARALEICSDVNFIWIIRFPAGAGDVNIQKSLEGSLPQGFLGRVEGRGVVVTGWAPQADILAHPSVGGFVSHCGWSSVMESLCLGVPVIAMPMKLDQPINARMLVGAGGGVEVQRDESDGMFKGEEIAEAIGKVFTEEESREGLRQRAWELSKTLRMEKDGALDEVAEEVWRLCSKKMQSS